MVGLMWIEIACANHGYFQAMAHSSEYENLMHLEVSLRKADTVLSLTLPLQSHTYTHLNTAV